MGDRRPVTDPRTGMPAYLFVEARLDEEYAAARDLTESEAAAAEWYEMTSGVLVTGPPTADDTWDGTFAIGDSRITRFIAGHDPARVLREVAAKRAITARYREILNLRKIQRGDLAAAGALLVLSDVVEALASAWSDHPDYDPKWTL